MDPKPNLARDWWEAALGLLSIVFAVRAFFSLIAILRPVPPSIEQDVIYLAVIIAGVSTVAALAAKRFAFAERIKPFVNRFLYAAFGAGTFLGLWMLGGLPGHLAADKAYAEDQVCVDAGLKNTTSPLCHTQDGRAVAAWIDRNSQAYFLSIVSGDITQNVELACPGVQIFTATVGTVRDVRVDFYGNRIARVAASGLVCETTFAPAATATTGILVNAIFGLLVATFAASQLWGSRVLRRRAARREQAETPVTGST